MIIVEVVVCLQPTLTQMRGRLWCLSWRSWVTWATIRTLSTFWEPAPTEVSQHPLWALLLEGLRMSLKGVSQPVCMRNPHHVRVCFPRRALTRSLSSSGPVLVITEYCSLGDLLNFLRQKAETFVNLVMNIPEIMENSNDYKNICNQKWYIRRYVKVCVCEHFYFCQHPSFYFLACPGFFTLQWQRHLQHVFKHIFGDETKPAVTYWSIRWESHNSSIVLLESICFLASHLINGIPFWLVESLCEDNGDWPLDIDDLLRFSLQVAQGLDFLASRNVSDFGHTWDLHP